MATDPPDLSHSHDVVNSHSTDEASNRVGDKPASAKERNNVDEREVTTANNSVESQPVHRPSSKQDSPLETTTKDSKNVSGASTRHKAAEKYQVKDKYKREPHSSRGHTEREIKTKIEFKKPAEKKIESNTNSKDGTGTKYSSSRSQADASRRREKVVKSPESNSR